MHNLFVSLVDGKLQNKGEIHGGPRQKFFVAFLNNTKSQIRITEHEKYKEPKKEKNGTTLAV